jgi:hypothetical protein
LVTVEVRKESTVIYLSCDGHFCVPAHGISSVRHALLAPGSRANAYFTLVLL